MPIPDTLPLLSLDFEGATWRFWHLEGQLWARPDGRALDFVACFLDHDGSLKRALGGEAVHEGRARLRATLRNEGFFRAVELAEGERVLLHRGQTFALCGGELARSEVRGARWKTTRFLLETPSEELQAALRRERKRAGSDLGKAFEWLLLPPDARQFFGLQWTTGDGAMLRRLVLAAFWDCAELWQERAHLEYRLCAAPGTEFTPETAFVDFSGPRPRFKSAPPALGVRLQKIVARNRPFLPRGVRLNREVGVGPLAQRETGKVATLRFPITAPNAHEFLEARLDIRDWLREEAPELLGD